VIANGIIATGIVMDVAAVAMLIPVIILPYQQI